MKRQIFYATVFLVLGTTSVSSQNSDDLVGAWEIHYLEHVLTAFNDTLYETEFVNPSVKILTKKHFAFGHLTDNRESISAGGGEYSYNGKIYTEHIKYHTHTSAVGISIEFKSKLEGDKWTILGMIPTDDGDVKTKEIWQRIE